MRKSLLLILRSGIAVLLALLLGTTASAAPVFNGTYNYTVNRGPGGWGFEEGWKLLIGAFVSPSPGTEIVSVQARNLLVDNAVVPLRRFNAGPAFGPDQYIATTAFENLYDQTGTWAFTATDNTGASFTVTGYALAEGRQIPVAENISFSDRSTAPTVSWDPRSFTIIGFSSPQFVATDSSGNVYVTDWADNTIQKFTGGGGFLAQWGGTGSGVGQFNNPGGVAVDGSGYVYVVDETNNRIQKFDGNGSYLTQWGTTGTGNGQFLGPVGVATDGSGNVYVTDWSRRVQKFTGNGTYLTQWGTWGSGNGQFLYPIGVATDGTGNVYVADQANHRIQKFDGNGTYLTQWGTYGTGNGQFYYPYGVATDGTGNVYVADSFNRRIQKFDGNGTYLTQWGEGPGTGNGQFYYTYGVATDGSGNVYVADTNNRRIQKFDSTGTFLLVWGGTGVTTTQEVNGYQVRLLTSANNQFYKSPQLPSGTTSFKIPDGFLTAGEMVTVRVDAIDYPSGFPGQLQNISSSFAGFDPRGPTRVSVASDGTQGNDGSFNSSTSADGRYVAFHSDASDLVAGDTNGSPDIFVHDRRTGQTTRVSVDSAGAQANGWSRDPSISADGRIVAFWSLASNLVAGDGNGLMDVFVHDLQTGHTTRVSVDSAGAEGHGVSNSPSISADGRFVGFESNSTLVAGDSNSWRDIFIHDRLTATTTRVSVDSAGAQANGNSNSPSISADGRFVAFASDATNLVPGDTNGTSDIFVHDRLTASTTRASVYSGGNQRDYYSYSPSISADGRFVAFESDPFPGDTSGNHGIFVHDRQTGDTSGVSEDSAGNQGNFISYHPSISADGRFVAFASAATNLVPGDTNTNDDVFVRDLQTGQTTRVSVDSLGNQGNSGNIHPSISSDGRFVAFESDASAMVPGDTNLMRDVFIVARPGDGTTRVSVDSTGNESNGASDFSSVSADGRYVAFTSVAANLVPGDTNGTPDIFVRDRWTGQTGRSSVDAAGIQGIFGGGGPPSASADGRYVAFESIANNLVPGDTNDVHDIFVRELATGTVTRVSVDNAGIQGNGPSQFPSISEDGRYVVFQSTATNLVVDDTNNSQDIFVHDLISHTTIRASVSYLGLGSSDSGFGLPSISANGRYVVFWGKALNFVAEDLLGSWSAYVRDLQANTTTLGSKPFGPPVLGRSFISDDGKFVAYTGDDHQVYVYDKAADLLTLISSTHPSPPGGLPGDDISRISGMSSDGRFVLFDSVAANLVENDTNSVTDVFVHDRLLGQTTLVSVDSVGNQANAPSSQDPWAAGPTYSSISADGRNVSFYSLASNLVPADTNGTADIFVFDTHAYTVLSPVENLFAAGSSVSWTPNPADAGKVASHKIAYGTTSGNHPSTIFTGSSGTTHSLLGLAPGMYYIVVASVDGNGNESAYSNEVVVTVALSATTGSIVTGVTSTGATLTGNITTGGLDTTYWFEYGTDPSLAMFFATPPPPASTAGGDFSTALSGLVPGTTYYFRIVAQNSDGTVRGGIEAFTTPAGAGDTDGDGLTDDVDPCPDDADNDIDQDRVCVGSRFNPPMQDGGDNCPWKFNPPMDWIDVNEVEHVNSQPDFDHDGVGDECDNCPDISNPVSVAPWLDDKGISHPAGTQVDTNLNSFGDVCDAVLPVPSLEQPSTTATAIDNDADGVPDGRDNCPTKPNAFSLVAWNDILGQSHPSGTQVDFDLDGLGDACDPCPDDPDNDVDRDGYCVGSRFDPAVKSGGGDNCPLANNPTQADSDLDGVGDACDPDKDGDGVRISKDGNGFYGYLVADRSRALSKAELAGIPLADRLAYPIVSVPDCNDVNVNVNPGMREIPGTNGVDEDCNPATFDSGTLGIVFDWVSPADSSYDTWLPTGDNTVPSATVKVNVRAVDGTTMEDVSGVTWSYQLVNVTKYPGKYTNDTSTNADNDFRFTYAGNQLTFVSNDYGGSITVRATATKGGMTTLVNTFTLPKDTDGDGLPDAWESLYNMNGALTYGGDVETTQGSPYIGDNVTNFEEYRGFRWGRLVEVNTSDSGAPGYDPRYATPTWIPEMEAGNSKRVKVQHIRTDPFRKDLFVKFYVYDASVAGTDPRKKYGYDTFDANVDNVVLYPFALGEAFRNAGIDVWVMNADNAATLGEMNIDVVQLRHERAANAAGTDGNINKNGRRNWSWDTKGSTPGLGTAAAYAPTTGISTTYHIALVNNFGQKPYRDQSWDANHPLVGGMLDSADMVQDSDDDGLPTNSLGDLYIPYSTSNKFANQLSPFDIDKNGKIELPLQAEPLSIDRLHEYTRLQVLKHTITHELGHATGAGHNANANCLMFQYTINYSRDMNFSPDALRQIQIHNN